MHTYPNHLSYTYPNHMSSHTHTLTASSTSHTHTQSHILSHTHTQSHVLSYTYPTTCPPIHIPKLNHLSSHTHTQSHVLSHTQTLITSSTAHTLTQSHILSYTYPITCLASHTHTTVISPYPPPPHISITSQSIPIMHNLIASSPISYYYVYILILVM